MADACPAWCLLKYPILDLQLLFYEFVLAHFFVHRITEYPRVHMTPLSHLPGPHQNIFIPLTFEIGLTMRNMWTDMYVTWVARAHKHAGVPVHSCRDQSRPSGVFVTFCLRWGLLLNRSWLFQGGQPGLGPTRLYPNAGVISSHVSLLTGYSGSDTDPHASRASALIHSAASPARHVYVTPLPALSDHQGCATHFCFKTWVWTLLSG